MNALGLALGCGSFWGVYVLVYCLLALSTVLAYLLLKVRVGWLVASVAALFFILEVAHLTPGNHEEEYAVVLQSVALFLLVRKPSVEARSWPWFVAGVLAAGALLLKPTGMGLWVSLTITVVIVSLRAGQWRDGSRHLLMGIAGAATASVGFLAYLAASGALGGLVADFRLSSIIYGAGQVGYVSAAGVFAAWTLVSWRELRRNDERPKRGCTCAVGRGMAASRGAAVGHFGLLANAVLLPLAAAGSAAPRLGHRRAQEATPTCVQSQAPSAALVRRGNPRGAGLRRFAVANVGETP